MIETCSLCKKQKNKMCQADALVNLDRSTWDAQFKKAIKGAQKPERSIWPVDISAKADKEWNW